MRTTLESHSLILSFIVWSVRTNKGYLSFFTIRHIEPIISQRA